jgi:Predicted acetyltransferase
MLKMRMPRPNAPTNEFLSLWADEVAQRLGLKTFSVYRSGENIKLHLLIVDKAEQRQGRGSQAVRELCDLADLYGRRIILTPGSQDDHHGTISRSRLISFYKRFGFKENKGRDKDFSISATMYRDPKRT